MDTKDQLRRMSGITLGEKLTLWKIIGQYPKTPEGRLFAAVFDRAFVDIYKRRGKKKYRDNHKRLALFYLRGPVFDEHCEMFGVSSAWVRETLEKMRPEIKLWTNA